MTSDERQPVTDAADVEGAAPGAPVETGEWRQAHWAFIVIGGIRNLRGLVLPLAVLLVTRGFRGGVEDLFFYGIAVLAAAFSVGASLVEWWNYRYRVSERDITLKSGIISRRERAVPFERIQAVNITEAPLERAFQVVRMHVDTGAGGSAASEVELRALTREEATALRAHLLAARQRLRGAAASTDSLPDATPAVGAVAGPGSGTLIRKLSTRELLIAGATSGRVGAAAAIVGILVQFGEELVPRRVWERVPWDGLADAAQSIQVVAATVATLGLLAWLISIVATVLTYGGFELRREGDQLLVQHGLLDRRRATIPIRRIQAVRVVETLMRQSFGYAEVRFDLAGVGSEQGGQGVLSPLLPKRDLVSLLEAACPDFAVDFPSVDLRTLPSRARRRYIVAASIGWVVAVVIAAVIVWRFLDVPAWWAPLALGLTPVFALIGNLRYRDAGWRVDDGRFLMRWRAIARVTVVTRVRRLQFRELTADPFQRRAGLVTFRTAVASGGSREGFSLAHLDRAEAEALTRQLGGRRGHSAPPVPFVPRAAARPGTTGTT